MRFATPAALLSALVLTACSGNGEESGGGDGSGPAAHVVSVEKGKTGNFAARHELKVTVPEGAKKVRVWFALPQNDPAQTISDLKIECALPNKTVTDSEANTTLYVEAEGVKEVAILTTFHVARVEQITKPDAGKARALTDSEKKALEKYLGANANVIIDEKVKALAKEIVGDETNSLKAARRIYDWELANIEYWVKDPKNKKASPVGSTEYCMTSKTGNCTDFHSLWTSLARASGIPTRMVYGSFFKKELGGVDKDQSYHCWPEFYVGGIGWIPHDVAVADIFVGDFTISEDNKGPVNLTTADGYTGADKAKVDWYFGNIDERRVTWSRGRDLTMSPKQDGGPVNAMAKAYIEVDGKPLSEKQTDGKTFNWVRKLSYTEK